MTLPKRQRVSDALHTIASLMQEADGYLYELTATFKLGKVHKKRKKEGMEPTAPDPLAALDRRVANKVRKPKFTGARRSADRESYHSRKNLVGPPRKSFGTRLRKR